MNYEKDKFINAPTFSWIETKQVFEAAGGMKNKV